MTPELHSQLIAFADAHQAADEYVAGTYDGGGNKGCAIGCAVKDCQRLGLMDRGANFGDHAALASATGIPEMVLRLQDHIFEGLPGDARAEWPPRFWRAVRPGAEYKYVPARIMARLADRLADDALRDDVREVARRMADLWRRRASGDEPAESEWAVAYQQADAAYQQADAARQQADAARQQAGLAYQQAGLAYQQAGLAYQQADAAWHQAGVARQQARLPRQQAGLAYQQADAAWHQAGVARQQAYSARQQAYTAFHQAYTARFHQACTARHDFWRWCADVVCEELAR